MNIKELHKIISDEKKEIIKKSDLAKALNYSREYVGQLFKDDKKQISLDRIELASASYKIPLEKFQKAENGITTTPEEMLKQIQEFFFVDNNEMQTVEVFLKSGRFRSLVKILFEALQGNEEKFEAVMGILKIPELAKTFIE